MGIIVLLLGVYVLVDPRSPKSEVTAAGLPGAKDVIVATTPGQGRDDLVFLINSKKKCIMAYNGGRGATGIRLIAARWYDYDAAILNHIGDTARLKVEGKGATYIDMVKAFEEAQRRAGGGTP